MYPGGLTQCLGIWRSRVTVPSLSTHSDRDRLSISRARGHNQSTTREAQHQDQMLLMRERLFRIYTTYIARASTKKKGPFLDWKCNSWNSLCKESKNDSGQVCDCPWTAHILPQLSILRPPWVFMRFPCNLQISHPLPAKKNSSEDEEA